MDKILNSEIVRAFDKEAGVVFLGNSLSHWFAAVILLVAIYFLLKFAFRKICIQIEKISKKTRTNIDDVLVGALKKSGFWFFAAIALFFSARVLNLGEYSFVPLKILTLTTFFQIGIWVSVVFNGVLKNWSEKNNQNPTQNAAVAILRWLGKFFIWAVILLLTLDNLGVKVVSLLAGLGVGGIAVALAVQKILGDLFASISIMLDKPFEIGDYITVGGVSGTVESIGVKTTRIRSATGEQIVVANSDLLDSRVSNFKRMKERRITFGIGVTYQTTRENLNAIVEIVKGIIAEQENTRFDRGHLKGFGASSIDYEFVFWITKPDYLTYMDMQQKINLSIIDVFDRKKIDFAYPTQTLFVSNAPAV
ncbi:hypothetical protein AGMMS49938_05870 [Fibrobacterales bacterium]|nr:hypothetical protein AGMMS49938_05870 [Fibrobacterales bacterium]